jgi:acyl transferase domain-containing protein/acyl carrier protein
MTTGSEIAIVGMSGRFPGAENVGRFWENLRSGRESIVPESAQTSAPVDELAARAHWVKVNSLIPGIDLFDASFFGFSPREAEMMDPQHRIVLECAWEALEDAGCRAGDIVRHVGVFAGSSLSAYIFSQFTPGAHLLETLPAILANDKDYLATRTSYKLNFSGPSITVQCACSTSLVAVHLACQSLIAGECDAALAGGISVVVPRMDRYLYLPGSLLSPDSRCRAFDAKARGTAFAEGIGLVLLMRLEDALRDGYPVRAMILGSAMNNDGSLKAGYTAPSIDGQMQVIRQALGVAGVDPADIGYVEAHGTGTVLGDAVELAALTRVFRGTTRDVGFCGLGSVKTNIGHLSTAAGIAGLIKTVLALEHEQIPASLNFDEPNPDLDLASSPFYIPTSLTPWPRGGKPRRAGVSSFGVGGTNAHVVLEEAAVQESSSSSRSWHVLVVSARTETALARASETICSDLETHPDRTFADVVYTLQVGRRGFEHRRAVICTDAADAVRALRSNDANRVLTKRTAAEQPPIAFMFTGQGAQSLGMGSELYRTERAYRVRADECLERLDSPLESQLRLLLFGDAAPTSEHAARLQDTEVAQPALFVTEYALSGLLSSWGIRPDLLIGHSIGEYVAACLAGVFSLDDAVRLVAARGRLMQRMPVGRMLSVACSADELRGQLPADVNLAAVNGPRQCVVAGTSEAIARLEQDLLSRSVAARPLKTSHAFHSSMMEPILDAFGRELSRVTFRAPTIPCVSNLTGSLASPELMADPHYWVQHVRQPVLFADGVQTLLARGARLFVEVGPGRTLTALARQCGAEAKGATILDTMPDAGVQATEAFWLARATAKLWLAGSAPDWPVLYAGERPRRVALPTYPFERQRYWNELQPTEKRETDSGKKSDIAEWFYAPAWRRLGPAGQPDGRAAAERRTLVCSDESGLGQEIADALRRAGGSVTVVRTRSEPPRSDDALVMDPSADADYDALAALIASRDLRLTHVVHCWSVTAAGADVDEAEAFQRAQQRGLFSAMRLLKALEDAKSIDALTFDIVSSGLFDVTGGESLRPENAPLLAFAKVIPQERPGVTCRVFDVGLAEPGAARDAGVGAALGRHIALEPNELMLAFRCGYRWAQRFDAVDSTQWAESAPRLKSGGVYLITGGLGRIGLTLAHYLAERWQARLVLTARSAFPAKEDWTAHLEREDTDAVLRERLRALQAIERAGGEVWVTQADAASKDQMAGVRQFIEDRYGRLDGIVFSAGRTMLQRSTYEESWIRECEAQFEAKAYGLMTLRDVFCDRDLDFCVVMSSLSSVLGGLGYLPYSSTNQVADLLVRQRNRGRSDLWTSVNWDAWQFEDLGVDAAMKAALLRLSMEPHEGVAAFETLLRLPPSDQLVISTASLQKRLEDWVKLRSLQREGPDEARAAGHAYARPNLDTPYAEPDGDLERRIAEIWQRTLGIDRVGRDDDFFELGGHSLVAIQMLSHVHQRFGIDFPIERAFEATTVRKAAVVLDDLLKEKVLSLSDEEAEQILKQGEIGV